MRKIPKNCFLYILLSLLLAITFACDRIQERGIDTELLQKEMADREVRKLSQGEIMEGALRQGTALADSCFALLESAVRTTLENEGWESATTLCATLDIPALQNLEKNQILQIRRPGALASQDAHQPESLEEQLLSAYQYNVEQELDLKPNVQITNDQILYTRPIVIRESVCTQCHGMEAQEAIKQLIRRHSPDHPATDYKEGELLGMWAILIPRKEIIRNL